jgi:hypothetical protein
MQVNIGYELNQLESPVYSSSMHRQQLNKNTWSGLSKVRFFSVLFDVETIVNRLIVFHFHISYFVLVVTSQ